MYKHTFTYLAIVPTKTHKRSLNIYQGAAFHPVDESLHFWRLQTRTTKPIQTQGKDELEIYYNNLADQSPFVVIVSRAAMLRHTQT